MNGSANTKDAIRAIVASVLRIDPERIADGAVLSAEFPTDSLTMLEIALKIEDAFQVSIPNSDYPQMTSIESIAGRVLELRSRAPEVAAP